MKDARWLGVVVVTGLGMVLGLHGVAQAAEIPDPGSFFQETYLGTNSTQTFDVHALGTLGIDPTTGQPIIIAIIGAGVDTAHEDLQGKFWANPGEIPANGVDDDGNGYIDDVFGWDFIQNDSDPRPEGSIPLARATGMAGIAAASTGNGVGIKGVCPACQILNVRAAVSLGQYESSETAVNQNLTEAVHYAADLIATSAHKKGVILLSIVPEDRNRLNGELGVDPALRSLLDAIFDQEGDYDGTNITVVAPAGNRLSSVKDYPCAYTDPDPGEAQQHPILCVGSTDTNEDTRDMRSVFSNFGDWVLVGAPGQNILATLPGDQYGFLSFTQQFGGVIVPRGSVDEFLFNEASGSDSSAAAAIVAGQVGLVLAELDALQDQIRLDTGDPTITLGPKDVQELVRFDVYRTDLLPSPDEAIVQLSFDLELGSGRINTHTAVQDALGVLAVTTGISSRKGPVALLSFPATNYPLTVGESVRIRGSVVGDNYTLTLKKDLCTFCRPVTFDPAFTPLTLYDSGTGPFTLSNPSSTLLPAPWIVPALAEGAYSIELRTTSATTNRVAVSRRRIIVEQHYKAGWPKFVDDTFFHGANLGDFTGNGQLEVIVGSSKARRQGVYVFAADGTQLYQDMSDTSGKTLLRTCSPGSPTDCSRVFSTPALGDITGDGVLDIVATGDGSGPSVFAWDRNGAPLGKPLFTKNFPDIKSAPALGPATTGSSLKDIFVTTTGGVLAWLDGMGDLQGFAFVKSGGQASLMESSPLLPDIDSDGVVEVIVPAQELNTDQSTTYGFRLGNGTLDPLPNFPLAPDGTQPAPGLIFDASAGDFNLDGTLDLVLPQVRKNSNDSQLVLVDTTTGATIASFNPGGHELFMYVGAASGDLGTYIDSDIPPDGIREYASAVPDGLLETVIVGMSGRVYILDHELLPISAAHGNVCHDGTAGQWPQSASWLRMHGRGAGSPAIADLDYDGVPEIITTGSDKAIYAWTPEGCLKTTLGSGVATRYGFPRGLKAPACVNPFPEASPLKKWAIEDISRCAAPAVGDLDGDGRLELVAVAGSGVTGENGIYVWELSPYVVSEPVVAQAVVWGVYGGNPEATRTVARVDPVEPVEVYGTIGCAGMFDTSLGAPIGGASVTIRKYGGGAPVCETTSVADGTAVGTYTCLVPPRTPAADEPFAYIVRAYHFDCQGSGPHSTKISDIPAGSAPMQVDVRKGKGYLGCLFGCC